MSVKNNSATLQQNLFFFLTRCGPNRTVQPKKMARGLKFPIEEVEGLYYLHSKNKDTDQQLGYSTADLRLCFCICKKIF